MQRLKYYHILMFLGLCTLFACQWWNKPDYTGWRTEFAALGDSTLLLKMSEASNASVAEIIATCKIGTFANIVVTELVNRSDSVLFNLNFWEASVNGRASGKQIEFGMANAQEAYSRLVFRFAYQSLLVACQKQKIIPIVSKGDDTGILFVLCNGKVVWSKRSETTSLPMGGSDCPDCIPSVNKLYY